MWGWRLLLRSIFLFVLIIGNATAESPRRHSINSSAIQYDLNVRVLPDARRLEVTGTMRLPASIRPTSEFHLSLSALMRGFQLEVIEPSSNAGVAILEQRDATGKNIKWTARPPHPVPAGESVLLRFSYAGGEQIANQFYIGPEVSFASAWGTDWYPLLDVENDQGIGSIRLSVPTGLTGIATGVSRTSSEEKAQGTFRFEVSHPTYFAFAAGKYNVARREGAVPISAYLLRPHENMQNYLAGVEKILNVLIHEFGAFPFPEFALVELPRDLAQRAQLNAAGVQGFILTNSRAFDAPKIDYLLEWFGHEFAHEWFPHSLALRTPPGRYMEESLAEYGGLRVVETMAGAAAAERFRRTGFEYDPIYSALAYFKLAAAGVDHPLGDLQSKMEHRNLAYNKGFLVFDMLSREIGREKFQRIIRGAIRRHAFKGISWKEFLLAIEVGAGRDLRWFYRQWFERTGAPEFQLTWRQEGPGLRGAITQTAPYYRATLEMEFLGSQGQRLNHKVEIRGARTEFMVPLRFHVQSVVLDPHYLILRWTPEYRALANAPRS